MGNFVKNGLRLVFLGLLSVCFAIACSKDVDPDPEKKPDPNQQEDPKEDPKAENTTAMEDPDALSEYLVMTGESKMTGSLPQAQDGQLKINVRDTAYAVKGYPIAAPRMLIKKLVGLEIVSFNVQVGGASFYYNLPADKPTDLVPMESDSLNLLVLDVQPPDGIALPLSLDIKIQALDASGAPLDEFSKVITVEDPNSSSCSLMSSNPCPGQHPFFCDGLATWTWTTTFFHNTEKHIDPEIWDYAPTWKTIGCCMPDGTSVFEFDDHRCRPDGNNVDYKELDVTETGTQRGRFNLGLYDDGEFYTYSSIKTRNIDTQNMDFCDGSVPYIDHEEGGFLGGTHDYSNGADFINFNFDPTFDTGGYRPFWAGEIPFYTCNTLVIREPDPEGDFGLEVTHVFKRYKKPPPLTVTITFTEGETYYD